MRFDIFRLTIRQLLGFHRIGVLILILFVVGIPIFIAATAVAFEANMINERFLINLFQGSQLPIFYPIVVLFLAALALREEIDNDTVLYLWTKPVSRVSIVISKFIAAFLIAAIVCGLSAAITSLILMPNDIALASQFALATVLGLLAYGALFYIFSLATSRTLSIILGLAYAIIWEGLLSRISSLTANLSIRHYATNFAANVIDVKNIERYLPSTLSLTTSLIVLLAITGVLLLASIWRFSNMELPGES